MSTTTPAQKIDYQATSSRRTTWPRIMQPAAVLWMAAALLIVTGLASRWPLVHDAPLIHYVVFLMDHGWAPYRDIVEMNMPGAYVIEAWAMRLFGGDAFGWWLWDTLTGLTVIAGSVWIAGPQRKWAGFIAGSLACISHLSDGPGNLGQRDWVVTALLILSVGCLFEAIRKRQPVWMTGFMLLCAAAASIKPPAILLAGALLIVACWQQGNALRLDGRPAVYRTIGALVGWSIAGGLVTVAIVAFYIVRWGTFNEFIGMLRSLVPYYAGLHPKPPVPMIHEAVAYPSLLLGGLLVFLATRSWRRWESITLLLAAAIGALLFFIQGKGWSYHLYTERAFVALWAMLELEHALRCGGKWERRAAVATLALVLLVQSPLDVVTAYVEHYPAESLDHLEADLADLGGEKLSGQVQCLDMTLGGCINALYRQRIVQSTGFIYDYYLFPAQPTNVTDSLQARFLGDMNTAAPRYIVVTSHTWPAEVFNYDQLNRWPAFKNFLDQRYAVVRTFSDSKSIGYRIYMLKGHGQ